ncbi:siderophore iron transporter [Fonsecaea pedrosoi]|nr:siderophore iron transporter [Fonsecaea pedrosoi]
MTADQGNHGVPEGIAGPTTKEKPVPGVVDHVDVVDNVDVVQATHVDGTVDLVDKRAIGGDLNEMPPGYFRSWQFIGTVAAATFMNMASQVSWVMPANTLMLMDQDLGPSKNINWVATAWTLTYGLSVLLYGRLSDIFGRKWITIWLNVSGVVGAIVGATAQSVEALIGANICTGISAGAQLSSPTILGEIVPNRYRTPIVGLVFFLTFPWATFGPLIARLFILHTAATWRWSYYIGIIFSGLSTVLLVLCYNPPRYTQLHVHGKSEWRQFLELDWGGLFLYSAGLVIFLIGLSWGGQVYDWSDAHVVSTIIVGGILLILFGLYEQYVVKGHGLMPPRLFKNIGFVAVVATSSVGGMVYFSMTVMWPTIVGTVFTSDIISIGWQSAVVGGGVIFGQVFSGLCMAVLPKLKYQAIVSSTLAATFTAALASISPARHASAIAFGVIATFSVGFIDNVGFAGVSLLVEPSDIGLACGVLGSLRTIAGSVAQALYISISTTEITKNLPAFIAPAVVQAGLPQTSLPALFAGLTTGDFSAVPGATPEILGIAAEQAKLAYAKSFRMVFFATIPFGVILIVMSFWVPNIEKFLHNNVARKLQFGTKRSHETGEKTHEQA